MIETIIGAVAHKEFKQALQFTNTSNIFLPRDSHKKERLLYLHVPFCEQLCPYCSFNRIVFDEQLCREYFLALRKEIILYKQAGYDFNGIYVGGGTPTVMIDELTATLALAKKEFSIKEISVETNPNHITEKNMESLMEQGVGRLSVGIQSFNDDLLKKMQRYDKYGSGEAIAERIA
ncbi:MAG: radical SAM protein, partial [Deltaproteobacteria bacterium]